MYSLIRNSLKLSIIFSKNIKRNIKSVVPIIKFEKTALKNEPILTYSKGSPERVDLEHTLKSMSSVIQEVPIVIAGKEIHGPIERFQTMPHNHKHKIARFSYATGYMLDIAIKAAVCAQQKWDRSSIGERIKIWETAADLMAGKYRQELNAATMLGQAKTVIQAEIDSSAELIDFIRMNTAFLKELYEYQPISVDKEKTLNSLRYRGMDGFIAAISPFNFTAIGGNLSFTPALMGNAVLWKPSDTAILSNWIIFKIMREAGVPPGVVNFVPSDGPIFGDTITSSPSLAGINFTGSVPTFKHLWRQVGENIGKYSNYPRLIGECGGKNYHFIHSSAEVESVINATIRAAFEYTGQKCSACSRMYVPESLWPVIKQKLIERTCRLKIGDVQDFSVFTSAVIDKKAFARITSYIDKAKNSPNLNILVGGLSNCDIGYFICPTIIETNDPLNELMTEEIFGPVLTVYVYNETDLKKTMELVATSTQFALTGAVFATDEQFLKEALVQFKYTAGNFYINDKCTGSVVGQQPFGGGRMSGTNDKAGGSHYILRWTSPQSIKETFEPLCHIGYSYMSD